MADPAPATLTVPATLDQLTPQWLSLVMEKQISPENFIVTPNAQAGSGFLSHVVRVSCETQDSKEPLKLIVKLLPTDAVMDGINLRQVIISEKFDEREIAFYHNIRPRLLEESKELSRYLCDFYAGYIIQEPKRDSVLVMEDLKPLGYSTYGFDKDLPWTQLEDAVRFMAEFHFTADAISFKEKKSLKEIWPFLDEGLNEETVDGSNVFQMSYDGYGKLDSFFEKHNVSPEVRKYYLLLNQVKSTVLRKIFTTQSKNRTLLHNDLWSNNMLVPNKDTMPLKIIDWQLVGVGNPAYDLAVVIISSTPVQHLKKEKVEQLVDLYLDTYFRLCDDRKLPEMKEFREKDEFKKFFFTYGMAHMFVWFTFTVYPFASDYSRLIKALVFLKDQVDVINFLLTLA